MILTCLLACTPPPPPPDVVLITLDTTRADALGAWGQDPSPTPCLDALAAGGTRFAEVQAAAPLTLPAHASLLTGLSPHVHGLRDNGGYHLSAEHRTLAEDLQAAGWATGAFVASIVLDDVGGLDQGYDTYWDGFDVSLGPEGFAWPFHRGEVVRERAVAWVEAQPTDAPLHVWMHLYDAHQPLQPPEPYASAWADPYLAEVAYADAQVCALLEAVDRRGRPRLVVAVADHGEGRGEHGELTHGTLVYRTTMHVPLIVSGPGVPAGRVVDGLRGAVDMAPTVLELAGLPGDLGEGHSLVPDLTAEQAAVPRTGETLHGRLHLGLAELRVVQDDTWRYILGPREELYAWREDPGELRDVHAAHPDVVAALRPLAEAVDLSGAPSVVDDDTRAALAQLGYVDAGATVPADVPGVDLPHPADHLDLADRFSALTVEARTRPPAEAVPLLEDFVEEWPHLGGARHLLVSARLASGDPDGALADLAPLVDARPNDPVLRTRRAEILVKLGDLAGARADLDAALAVNPEYTGAAAVLAEVRRRDGDCPGALELCAAGLERDPSASGLRVVRAACLLDGGDLPEAEVELSRVLESHPDEPTARLLMGSVLAASGQPEAALPHLERAHDLAPDNLGARLALAEVLVVAGRPAEAMPLVDDVEDPAARLLYADALLTGGGDPGRVLELLEDNPLRGAHRVRGAALLRLGRTQDALEETARGL